MTRGRRLAIATCVIGVQMVIAAAIAEPHASAAVVGLSTVVVFAWALGGKSRRDLAVKPADKAEETLMAIVIIGAAFVVIVVVAVAGLMWSRMQLPVRQVPPAEVDGG